MRRGFLLFCVLLLVLPSCFFGDDDKMIGQKAPETEGWGVKGEPIKLSDYHGKVVLLDFWGTWCPHCLKQIPGERALVERHRGRPFALLGIDCGDSREALREFIEKQPVPWANIVDGDQHIATRWGVKSWPTVFLIDHLGYVRGRWSGGGQREQIDAAIDKALKEAEKKQD
jgi:peroxiredoxin